MTLIPSLQDYVLFFNDTATTEIYTLSLHDALPIFGNVRIAVVRSWTRCKTRIYIRFGVFHADAGVRSEEHTSELQSHSDLVCRLLLEKKNNSAPACAMRLSTRNDADT